MNITEEQGSIEVGEKKGVSMLDLMNAVKNQHNLLRKAYNYYRYADKSEESVELLEEIKQQLDKRI